jgi:2-dehydropantoate 2-reductase
MVDFNQLPDLSQACYTLLTTHGSKIIQPFHVQHTGLGHNDLGLIYGSIQQKKQAQVVKALATALPSLTLSHHIKEKQWLKLAINCVINPLTAIDNIENGQLLQQKYSIIIDKLLAEIISVANKEDIIFSFDDLKNQVLDVAEKTAKNCSSMRSDILKKRKTEIDYINGYIANTAKKIGISVPEHEKLIQQVRALEVK